MIKNAFRCVFVFKHRKNARLQIPHQQIETLKIKQLTIGSTFNDDLVLKKITKKGNYRTSLLN
ncbi:MAG: hypothetical protein ACI935_000865 [Moritella dasanensis]|jgi:hypothetical protein